MADLRVAFLTHYYPPEVGAPQARISALARGLQQRGVQVTIHTGFPNYPAGHIDPPYRNRPLQREDGPDGLRIVRSAVLPTANKGFLPRIANHSAFAASCVASAPASGPQDVIVVESPPLFTAAAGVLYARSKGARLIAHVSDLWPASAVQLGALKSRHAVTAASRLESWVYRSADAITVPTRGMLRTLSDHPAAGGKVRRMPPYIELARFNGGSTVPDRNGGPLKLLYAGTVGLAQGIETLIDAALIVGPDVVELTIAGWGAEGDMAYSRIAQQGAGHVRMLGTVAPETIVDLYERAHVGVVLLKDKPLFAEALPTKLFESMAAGRPVLLSARGEAAETLQAADAGVVVAPEDAHALAESIRRLQAANNGTLSAMGARGRDHVQQQGSLEGGVERWLQLLESVAA